MVEAKVLEVDSAIECEVVPVTAAFVPKPKNENPALALLVVVLPQDAGWALVSALETPYEYEMSVGTPMTSTTTHEAATVTVGNGASGYCILHFQAAELL